MGHIKIDRKILEWEWYSDINTCRLFLHLLLKANWKPGRFMGVDIERGSLATSLPNLAAETGLSLQNVRTSIKKLKTTGELTVNQHPKFSVITIKNYTLYQDANSQLTVNQQATNSQLTPIEEDKNKEVNNNSITKVMLSESEDVFTTIRELYNSVCGSYPRLVKMSEARKKAINARMRTGYTVDDFKKLFEKAESSEFLKGKNNRNWSATFDWLISDSNMAKVLDGNYDEKRENKTKTANRFNNFPQRKYDFDSLEQQLTI